MSAIATISPTHQTNTLPRGVSTTAAREPQKKSTKPERLMAFLVTESLVVIKGNPLAVVSRRQQDYRPALMVMLNREVLTAQMRASKRRKKRIKKSTPREIADYLIDNGLVEVNTTVCTTTKRPESHLLVVSDAGKALLEQRYRSMHPSFRGARLRSRLVKEVAA